MRVLGSGLREIYYRPVRHAEMLSITQAARSAGVSVDLVRTQIEQGSIPAVRDDDGLWQIPHTSLDVLTNEAGMQLDLRNSADAAASPSQSDTLAAQAAVLLARTQATAARFQSQDFLRRLRDANNSAAVDRAARQKADEALTKAEQSVVELRRDQAVAEAKVEELRRQLENDDRHFQFMVDRISSLEWERQRLTQSLGWFGRVRYQRTLIQPSPPPDVDSASLIEPAPRQSMLGVDPGDVRSGAKPLYPLPEAPSRYNNTGADAVVTVQNLDPIG